MVQLTVVTFTVLIQLALMTQSSVGLPIQSADMLQLRSLNNQNEPFIQQLSKRVGNPLKCFSRLVTFCKGRRKKSGQVYEDGLIPVASEFEDSLHHPVEPAQTPPQLHRPQTGPHELPTGNQHDRPHELENTGRGYDNLCITQLALIFLLEVMLVRIIRSCRALSVQLNTAVLI
ncbi:hypothetical protein AX14_012267 [Amanita brunnescens Koide BX004]|nr:hypothetical protein AX14_012267 [Amanita brunnescens Koide BX004]